MLPLTGATQTEERDPMLWQKMVLMVILPHWRPSVDSQGDCACLQADTCEATECADDRKRGKTNKALALAIRCHVCTLLCSYQIGAACRVSVGMLMCNVLAPQQITCEMFGTGRCVRSNSHACSNITDCREPRAVRASRISLTASGRPGPGGQLRCHSDSTAGAGCRPAAGHRCAQSFPAAQKRVTAVQIEKSWECLAHHKRAPVAGSRCSSSTAWGSVLLQQTFH